MQKRSSHKLSAKPPSTKRITSTKLPHRCLGPIKRPQRSKHTSIRHAATATVAATVTARALAFKPTQPSSSGLFGWLKKKLDSGSQGELMGTCPRGNRYYEWVEASERQGTPTRRRVEYQDNNNPKPDQIHELWESWLRHGREHPPSPQEVERYELRRSKYFTQVKFNEERDHKVRLQEQFQRKLRGEATTDEKYGAAGQQEDAQKVIRDMVSGMEAELHRQQQQQQQQQQQDGLDDDVDGLRNDKPVEDFRSSWNPNKKDI